MINSLSANHAYLQTLYSNFIFLTFVLKLPNNAYFFVVLGGFDTLNKFFVIETLKMHILG